MFKIDFLNTLLFALVWLLAFYAIICISQKKLLIPEFGKLFFYVTIYSLFGIVGEVFVNKTYLFIFNEPLWEYKLFPAHDASISYFFIFIWGSLGVYKYFTELVFSESRLYRSFSPGVIMGGEAIAIELLYNGFFFLIFNEYIFYYLPANLGVISHFSCLQVIPFYFMVGFMITKLTKRQEAAGYHKSIFAFYWMIIVTFVFL